MSNIKKQKSQTLRLVELSILLSLVIAFQLLGSFIHIGPTSISLVLIPIALGAMLLGPAEAGFLGFAFGAVVLIAGVTGTDAFTNILFNEHPILTTLLCFGKSTAAGVVAGFLFKLISKKNKILAAFVTAASVPIINTGIFILGGLTMSKTLSANFVEEGSTVIYFLVIACAGLNFIAEFALNLVSAPALNLVYDVVTRRIRK